MLGYGNPTDPIFPANPKLWFLFKKKKRKKKDPLDLRVIFKMYLYKNLYRAHISPQGNPRRAQDAVWDGIFCS